MIRKPKLSQPLNSNLLKELAEVLWKAALLVFRHVQRLKRSELAETLWKAAQLVVIHRQRLERGEPAKAL